MVPSVYLVGTVSTLPLVLDCVPPNPILIIEDNPTMQQEVENQLHLHYTEAKVHLTAILAPRTRSHALAMGHLQLTRRVAAVNKWKEEVLVEQPLPSNWDSPFSFHSDQAASPESSVPTKGSEQAMHPVPSSPMPGSSQLMATTTLLVNLTEPVQGEENDNGKSKNAQAMEWESPLLMLSVSALADILETPKPPAA